MNKPCFLQNLTIVGATSAISIIGLGISNLSAQAAVITNGCTAINVFCTLEELDSGATIQVGDKLFTDWDIFFNQTVDLSNIEVSGIFQDTNAPGVKFTATNNALTAFGGNIDLTFDFQVTSLGEPIIDNELSLDQFSRSFDPVGGRAIIEIFENVGTSQGSSDLASKSVEYDEFGLTPPGLVRDKRFDRAVFSPQQSIWVRKDLNIISGGINGSTELNMFSQRFSQKAPEPTTILGLLTISSLGLGLKRRKQS